MKTFTLDIVVTQKSRLTVSFEAEEKPDCDELKEIIDNEGLLDILDEESIEILSVDKVGKGEGEEIEPDDDEEVEDE